MPVTIVSPNHMRGGVVTHYRVRSEERFLNFASRGEGGPVEYRDDQRSVRTPALPGFSSNDVSYLVNARDHESATARADSNPARIVTTRIGVDWQGSQL